MADKTLFIFFILLLTRMRDIRTQFDCKLMLFFCLFMYNILDVILLSKNFSISIIFTFSQFVIVIDSMVHNYRFDRVSINMIAMFRNSDFEMLAWLSFTSSIAIITFYFINNIDSFIRWKNVFVSFYKEHIQVCLN